LLKIFTPLIFIVVGYYLFSNLKNLLFFFNLVIVFLIYFFFTLGLINIINARFFGSNSNNNRSLLSSQRIGPHDYDVLCVLFGALLGDAYASVRYQKYGKTARFAFKQSIIHKSYLFYLYDFFFSKGYCSKSGPSLYTRTISGYEKVYSGYEFSTFSFASLV
jgi:LAGLIDADG DNA endonuclease family